MFASFFDASLVAAAENDGGLQFGEAQISPMVKF
jgi:hypothetical protein